MSVVFRGIFVSMAAALLVVAGARSGEAQGYILTDLGTLGGARSYGMGLSENGIVTGYADTGTGAQLPFLWQGGVVTAMPTLGGANGTGNTVNDAGHAAGSSQTTAGTFHACYYDGTAAIALAELPGGASGSAANSINATDQVTGYCYPTGYSVHAVLWSGGAVRDLGVLGGTNSIGFHVNDLGHVTGRSDWSGSPWTTHTFLWDGSRMIDLSPPDGSWSAGIAVNNRDEVAAYRSVTDHTYLDCHAFLVSGRTWTPIGNLGPDRPMSYPCDINDHGAVVGLSSYTYWTNSHAFLWQGGVIRDLNDFVPPSSGWVLSAAYAINNAGQIVGTGTLNGQSRAWLLTPAGMTSVAAPGGETAPPGTALAAVITPNPTRAECEISFELRTAGPVRAELFAVDGRRVATIADQDLARGRHRLAWDGRARGGERAAPGVYWLRIAAGGETATRAVHVVR